MPQFLERDVPAYAAQLYITGNVFRYFQIKLLEIVEGLGGYAVLGDGDQLYQLDQKLTRQTREDVFMNFEVGYAAPYEWCRRNNTTHQPFFFFSSPELCLSYLRAPLIEFVLQNPDILKHPNNKFLLKRMVYQSMWLDIDPRAKFSGFENIIELRANAQAKLRKQFDDLIQTCHLPIPKMIEQLEPQRSSSD